MYHRINCSSVGGLTSFWRAKIEMQSSSKVKLLNYKFDSKVMITFCSNSNSFFNCSISSSSVFFAWSAVDRADPPDPALALLFFLRVGNMASSFQLQLIQNFNSLRFIIIANWQKRLHTLKLAKIWFAFFEPPVPLCLIDIFFSFGKTQIPI